MNVEIIETIGISAGVFIAGEVYDAPMNYALDWCRCGIARETDRQPPEVERLLARLEDGAGRPVVFAPFVGEFGHLIMTHIRMVHFHRASRKVACCERGQEVLFPCADEFVTDWQHPIPDAFRVGSYRETVIAWPDIAARFPDHLFLPSGGLTPAQEIHAIRPRDPIPFRPTRRGLHADVAIGVRHRAFCPERNWPYFQRLADALTTAGFTFAVVGQKPTSYDIVGQRFHTGDFDTSATIELMQGCALYIGTDTGISHLASTVGVNMLLFRETAGGSRDLTGRMAQMNPWRTDVVAGGWTDPDAVINRALQTLGAR